MLTFFASALNVCQQPGLKVIMLFWVSLDLFATNQKTVVKSVFTYTFYDKSSSVFLSKNGSFNSFSNPTVLIQSLLLSKVVH